MAKRRPSQAALSRMSNREYEHLKKNHRPAEGIGRMSAKEYRELMGARSGLYGVWAKSVCRQGGDSNGEAK